MLGRMRIADAKHPVPGQAEWGGAGGTEGDGVSGTGGGVQADRTARILLLVDEAQEGGADEATRISARALKIGSATVERVRRRCVEEGVEAALGRRPQVEPPSEKAGRRE